MKLLQLRLQSKLYQAGLVCIAVSLFFFSIPFFGYSGNDEGGFGFFILSFMITWVYFLGMVVNRRGTPKEDKIHNTFLFLILFFISAWSLNRLMPVFETIPGWFAALLVFICFNYAGLGFAEKLPQWAVHIMSFIAGTGLATFIYLSLYLFPLYGYGLVGFFLVGISLHAFVPLLFTIYTFFLMKGVYGNNKKYSISFIAGLLFAILFVACYIGFWNQAKKQIDYAWEKSIEKPDMPQWINAAQHIQPAFFTKKILKTDLVYSTPEKLFDDFFWAEPGGFFGESKKHDPLVMMAVFLSGNTRMEINTRLRVLQSIYDVRHESQQRLWSGDDLFTEQVNTEVKVWPACNMGYTEKTITVAHADKKGFGIQEEAIYTFYLPEGGVVTSLSLWINDKEEKGIMSTKQKADSSYKTIVGRERRDPSVVHWQEGNSVSVRVFPVLAGESRKFKIGITAPLERANGRLRYENIYFKGPPFDEARESIRFDFEQPADNFRFPVTFTSMSKQSYKREGKYIPRWAMEIEEPHLSDCSFSFDGNTYALTPYHKRLSPAEFDKIYLDINRSWTRKEFNDVMELVKGKDVFVYDSAIIKVDEQNKEKVWTDLHQKQFSLFPLFEIQLPAASLVITKNAAESPGLDDLEGTGFMEKTKAYLQDTPKIKLFNLGGELSAYLRSLKEFRVFQYDNGDIESLENLLAKNFFPEDLENDNEVIIHKADMVIVKKEGVISSSGPDHLMRLFTYNHIMQKLGKGLLTDQSAAEGLVEEARKAYVVSPVSSLVVLETQEDYDRFNIKDADISLKNASLGSKGAVPEPHEWALIIATLLLLGYIMTRKKVKYS